jgi:hypothetical protein
VETILGPVLPTPWSNSELSGPPSLGTIGLKRKKWSNIFALQQVENDLVLLKRQKLKN